MHVEFNNKEARIRFSEAVLVYLLWNLTLDLLKRKDISQQAEGYITNVSCKQVRTKIHEGNVLFKIKISHVSHKRLKSYILSPHAYENLVLHFHVIQTFLKMMRHLLVDTGRILNVHKTLRRRPGRILNVLRTFNLRPVSAGSFMAFRTFTEIMKR